MTSRRSLLKALLLPTLLAAAGAAYAADWPADRPIRFIVPTAAGGGTDIFARTVAEQLGRALKQTIVVENKSGANGLIAQDFVAKSAPDGYTVMFTYTAAVVVNPALQAKMPYDTLKDLKPVAQIGAGGNYLVVASDVPVKNMKQFVAWIKENPGKHSYASWGIGSGGHLSMEALKTQTGINITHIPYRGNAPALTDLAGGVIKVAFTDTVSSLPYIKQGKIRPLAISGNNRAPLTPDIPTMNEEGYPFKLDSWYGIFVPGGTPDPIVKRINSEINRIMTLPEMKERFQQMNMAVAPQKSPEDFAQTVRDDLKAWGEIVRTNNIKLE